MDNFHGVYLLCSINNNKSVRGTYIGYTVSPGRRILQHNRFQLGGAKKTAKYAPWDMILIVHNFPNNTAALRFEWAWQNPKISVRLKMYDWRKRPKDSGVQHQIRVLEKMLNVAPWSKLPLTVQWLRGEYKVPLTPPVHMPIICGPIEDQFMASDAVEFQEGYCLICSDTVGKDTGIYCVNNHCVYHLICLARNWTGANSDILPISGECLKCSHQQTWGEMIKLKAKSNSKSVNDNDENHWTNVLSQQLDDSL